MEQPGAARPDRVDRADVDDRAAVALLAHPPGGRLRAEEHPLDVHRLDAAELLERQAVEQQVGEDAGVVDEDVEPAERLHGGLHEALGVFGVVHGSDRRGNRPALGRKPLRRRLEPVGPHIREQDGGAGVCQAVGAGKPEPLRGTGHEGAPAVEADELGDRAPVFHRKAL